jgi:hypothetical protein
MFEVEIADEPVIRIVLQRPSFPQPCIKSTPALRQFRQCHLLTGFGQDLSRIARTLAAAPNGIEFEKLLDRNPAAIIEGRVR